MNIRTFLEKRSREMCLTMGALIALVLSLHTIFASVPPLQDGAGYLLRGFALYGFLHTGQWAHFWQLLQQANQTILPPHYLFFFLLPSFLAGLATYVLALNFSVYLLLAYAVFRLARELGRREWAPAIFLLCSVNTVALSDYYAFFLDMQFLAMGLLVIAWQIEGWREGGARAGYLAGLGLGLLFWIKPANAVIYLVIFVLSEIVYAALDFCSDKVDGRTRLWASIRRWGRQGCGFAPIVVAALLCGGAQSILRLIHDNEVFSSAVPLYCHGLLRFFYFPLCLSFFYHVALLGGLFLAAFAGSRWRPGAARQAGGESFPWRLVIPVTVAFLVLGEFFSFWMLTKPMRSMLLVLPLFWFALFGLGERNRVRGEAMLLAAVVYAVAAFSQKAFYLLPAREPLPDVTYQLSTSSWTIMPNPWFRGSSFYQSIAEKVEQDLPQGGVVCVNSNPLRLSLTWRLNWPALLQGKPSPYEIRNLFENQGNYDDRALVGAEKVIILTGRAAPLSEVVLQESMDVLDFIQGVWGSREGLTRQEDLRSPQGMLEGCEILFLTPLSQQEVDRANQMEPFVELPRTVRDDRSDFSAAEARELLDAWLRKRMGLGPK